MSKSEASSRVGWLLVPVLGCVVALMLEAPAAVVIPLGILAFLVVGFGTRLFQQLAARKPFLSALLGGVAGITGLYLGAIAVLVMTNLGSPYFDARVTSLAAVPARVAACRARRVRRLRKRVYRCRHFECNSPEAV